MSPTVPASSFPEPKVAPNLSNAFGGVMRLALYRCTAPSYWLRTAGMMLLIAVLAGASTHQGGRDNFLSWTAEFYITFFIPALAFLSGGGAIRDEMKSNAVDYILTRPIPRWAYLIFRYTAQWATAQISYLLVFGVLLGVGLYRHFGFSGSDLALLFLAQVLAITVFMAFGFLFGVLTSRYVVAGLVYGAVVEIGLGHVPIQLSGLSMLHQLHNLLDLLESSASIPLAALQTSTIIIAVTLGMLALAATMFAHRELAGARPSDT